MTTLCLADIVRFVANQAGIYRLVHVQRLWSDEWFRGLSVPPPNGRDLWLYLLFPREGTQLPGLFPATPGSMADTLRWDRDGFLTAFQEVASHPHPERPGEPRVVADWEAGLVWVPNAIHYNRPDNPNVVRGWRKWRDALPECVLKRRALQSLRESLRGMGKAFEEAFMDAFPETRVAQRPLPPPGPQLRQERSPQRSPQRSANGMAKTENRKQRTGKSLPTGPESNFGTGFMSTPGQAGGQGVLSGLAVSTPVELQRLWNAVVTPPLPSWEHMTQQRERAARLRLAERPIEGPAGWRVALWRLEASPFCRGGGKNGWVADVKWFLRADSAARILAGDYDATPAPDLRRRFRARCCFLGCEREGSVGWDDAAGLLRTEAALCVQHGEAFEVFQHGLGRMATSEWRVENLREWKLELGHPPLLPAAQGDRDSGSQEVM